VAEARAAGQPAIRCAARTRIRRQRRANDRPQSRAGPRSRPKIESSHPAQASRPPPHEPARAWSRAETAGGRSVRALAAIQYVRMGHAFHRIATLGRPGHVPPCSTQIKGRERACPSLAASRRSRWPAPSSLQAYPRAPIPRAPGQHRRLASPPSPPPVSQRRRLAHQACRRSVSAAHPSTSRPRGPR
jgi:hypothetical protein